MRKILVLFVALCTLTSLGACNKFKLDKDKGAGSKAYTPSAEGSGVSVRDCKKTHTVTPYERPLAVSLADGKNLAYIAIDLCVNEKTKEKDLTDSDTQIMQIVTIYLSRFKKSDLNDGDKTLAFLKENLASEISKQFPFVLDVYPYNFAIEDSKDGRPSMETTKEGKDIKK